MELRRIAILGLVLALMAVGAPPASAASLALGERQGAGLRSAE